jgi:hypothetical protein
MFEDYTESGAGQNAMMDEGGTSPFETGVGGGVGAEVHIDGTPFRLATFVIAGILVLVLFNQGGFRFHVTV